MIRWRERVAANWMYFDLGRYAVQAFIQVVLLPVGIVRYLGAPLWVAVIVGPVSIGACIVLGRIQKTHGWLRQSNVVGVLESLSPLAIVQYELLWRLCDRLGISCQVDARPSSQVTRMLRDACRHADGGHDEPL